MKKLAILLGLIVVCAACAALTPEQQESIATGTGTVVGTAVTAVTGGNAALGAAAMAGVTTLVNWLIGRDKKT